MIKRARLKAQQLVEAEKIKLKRKTNRLKSGRNFLDAMLGPTPRFDKKRVVKKTSGGVKARRKQYVIVGGKAYLKAGVKSKRKTKNKAVVEKAKSKPKSLVSGWNF